MTAAGPEAFIPPNPNEHVKAAQPQPEAVVPPVDQAAEALVSSKLAQIGEQGIADIPKPTGGHRTANATYEAAVIRKRAENQTAVETYKSNLDELSGEGFDRTQALLVMDLREERAAQRADLEAEVAAQNKAGAERYAADKAAHEKAVAQGKADASEPTPFFPGKLKADSSFDKQAKEFIKTHGIKSKQELAEVTSSVSAAAGRRQAERNQAEDAKTDARAAVEAARTETTSVGTEETAPAITSRPSKGKSRVTAEKSASASRQKRAAPKTETAAPTQPTAEATSTQAESAAEAEPVEPLTLNQRFDALDVARSDGNVTVDNLMSRAGLSEDEAQRALDELDSKGFIVKRFPGDDTEGNPTYTYVRSSENYDAYAGLRQQVRTEMEAAEAAKSEERQQEAARTAESQAAQALAQPTTEATPTAPESAPASPESDVDTDDAAESLTPIQSFDALAYSRKMGSASIESLMSGAGLSKDEAEQALEELQNHGLIVKEPSGYNIERNPVYDFVESDENSRQFDALREQVRPELEAREAADNERRQRKAAAEQARQAAEAARTQAEAASAQTPNPSPEDDKRSPEKRIDDFLAGLEDDEYDQALELFATMRRNLGDSGTFNADDFTELDAAKRTEFLELLAASATDLDVERNADGKIVALNDPNFAPSVHPKPAAEQSDEHGDDSHEDEQHDGHHEAKTSWRKRLKDWRQERKSETKPYLEYRVDENGLRVPMPSRAERAERRAEMKDSLDYQNLLKERYAKTLERIKENQAATKENRISKRRLTTRQVAKLEAKQEAFRNKVAAKQQARLAEIDGEMAIGTVPEGAMGWNEYLAKSGQKKRKITTPGQYDTSDLPVDAKRTGDTVTRFQALDAELYANNPYQDQDVWSDKSLASRRRGLTNERKRILKNRSTDPATRQRLNEEYDWLSDQIIAIDSEQATRLDGSTTSAEEAATKVMDSGRIAANGLRKAVRNSSLTKQGREQKNQKRAEVRAEEAATLRRFDLETERQKQYVATVHALGDHDLADWINQGLQAEQQVQQIIGEAIRNGDAVEEASFREQLDKITENLHIMHEEAEDRAYQNVGPGGILAP